VFLLGKIYNREIFYSNLRDDKQWFDKLPNCNWVAFTITNDEDKSLIDEVVKHCLDKNVRYTCSTGELGQIVETSFDIEFVDRVIQNESFSGKPHDYEKDTLMTTSHENFSEGFWFAATTAYNDPYIFDKVICLDFTKRRVEKYLRQLIMQINNGWLPSEEEIEVPLYDDDL
jgi:hypothetical protein